MDLILLKTLKRFKHDNYANFINMAKFIEPSDLQELGIESMEDLQTWNKTQFCKQILKLAQTKKAMKLAIYQSDLLYTQMYPSKKLWTMFRMEKIPATNESIENAQTFSQNLKRQLRLFFKVDLALGVHRKAYWMRVDIKGSTRGAIPFYVVYFPNTDFIAISGLKATHKQIFIQAFLNVVDCHKMDMLQLKGYHLYSLFQLVHNKYNQGGMNAYKDELHETVTHTRTRSGEKRALSDDEESIDDVEKEDEALIKKRKEILSRTFGDADLPILQKVEYKLETRFRGTHYAPAMAQHTEPFRCSVKFEGTNVLEGLRNLAKAGLAELPMKDHVGKVHLLARNNFSLHMKPSNVSQLNNTGLSAANQSLTTK